MAESSAPGVAVIGGGPAGLMAAEVLAGRGARVRIHDRMPSPGRKLLLAGRGGLNLTHGEPLERFLDRYGPARARLEPAVRAFPPAAAVAWCEGLGEPTFVGTSGRIFPRAMKASPLLRAWLRRLASLGVEVRLRQRWRGWDEAGRLVLETEDAGLVREEPTAVVLALGGASWPRLGSDGSWQAVLSAAGIAVTGLRPANCGFRIAWTERFRAAHQGQPLKRIAMTAGGERVAGEALITAEGIEGGAVYALSARLRAALEAHGEARLLVDLRPDLGEAELARRLARPRGKQSLANHLRKAAGLSPVAIALVREVWRERLPVEAAPLANAIKHLELTLAGTSDIGRAISSAGGIAWSAVDEHLMLRARPGVFIAGEMLDWEAPTGGYLLQACLATGRAAGEGAARWLGLPGA